MIRQLGPRYINYDKWCKVKNAPYNYAKYGLLSKVLSNQIVNTDNSALKMILSYLENTSIFLMKYVDELRNFKNIHWRNR